MGRRGPKPKPTALKILEGNPGKRPLNDREPQPMKGRPRMPSNLPADEKRVWRQMIRHLESMKLLSTVDQNILERYCFDFVQWRKLSSFLKREGAVYEVKDRLGNVRSKLRPEFNIARNLSANLFKFETEYGMTPSSRSRLKIELVSENEVDPLKEILSRQIR